MLGLKLQKQSGWPRLVGLREDDQCDGLGDDLHHHARQRGGTGGPGHRRAVHGDGDTGVAEPDHPVRVVHVHDPRRVDDDVTEDVGLLLELIGSAGRDLPDLDEVGDLVRRAGVVHPSHALGGVLHHLADEDLRVDDLGLVVQPHDRLVEPVDVLQGVGHSGALDRVLARDLAPLARPDVADVPSGHGREVDFALADGHIVLGLPAVDREVAGAGLEGGVDDVLGDLDELPVIFDRAAHLLVELGCTLVVTPHPPLLEDPDDRRVDLLAVIVRDGEARPHPFPRESFHRVPSLCSGGSNCRDLCLFVPRRRSVIDCCAS